MAFALVGPVEFRGGTDPEGHREYKVKYKIRTTSNQDGPAQALQTPGLPAVGSTYVYGSDVDLWAWRRPELEVDPVGGVVEGDFPYLWYVTCTFSTKPRRADQERPHDSQVQDPLSEPQKVSLNWTKDKEQATQDRHGNPIQYSSFEPINGPLNEWDADKDQVVIEQNVPTLDYATYGPMKNTLNDRPMWGLPTRSIKLSGASVRKNWGKNNSPYYTRTFTFDIRTKIDSSARTVAGVQVTSGSNVLEVPNGSFGTSDIGHLITGTGISAGTTVTGIHYHGSGSGWTTFFVDISTAATVTGTQFVDVLSFGGLVGDWDRDLVDESGKCVDGYWTSSKPYRWITDPAADPDNPADYIQCVDPAGNPTRLILNGLGVPWDATMPQGSQGRVHVEYYRESNFLLLNVPLNL